MSDELRKRFEAKSLLEGSVGLGKPYVLDHGGGPVGESRLGDRLSSVASNYSISICIALHLGAQYL